ncbi:sigma-70 family RNA polymerase sigma factor [candidate division KSB1 bacterium]|nr:sigma-70 family RNA polymerase sigma factor [candidate division KSB1 bacterium]
MTDAQLIEKFLAGEISGFNTLVWRWEKRMFNFIYRYLGDFELSKDVSQKVFIKVYKNLRHLKSPEKFQSWIYQVAANLCKDEIKSLKRRSAISIESIQENNTESNYNIVQPEKGQPDTNLNHVELQELIKQALQVIPEEQRVVIIMKEYQGLKFVEIAEVLGEPLNTVKSRMYYGLNALRKVFDRWNISKEVLQYEV